MRFPFGLSHEEMEDILHNMWNHGRVLEGHFDGELPNRYDPDGAPPYDIKLAAVGTYYTAEILRPRRLSSGLRWDDYELEVKEFKTLLEALNWIEDNGWRVDV